MSPHGTWLLEEESFVHLNHALMSAVLNGDLPRQVLEKIVLEHLAALCPVCRQEIESFDWRQYRGGAPVTASYGSCLDRVVQVTRTTAADIENAHQQARRWLAELRRSPAEERAAKVARAHSRFRGDLFADLLVEEARSHLPGDPWEAFSWADTALAVHRNTPGIDSRPEVLVRILGHRGNALRATGRLTDAAAELHLARKILDRAGVTDLMISAELDNLEASLRKDRRELKEAERLLHRAILLYGMLGETVLRARAGIKLSVVYYDQDKLDDAILAAENAVRSLSIKEHPDLLLFARFNLARSLEGQNEPRKALSLLDEDHELQERLFDPQIKLRVIWLRGKIDRAFGRVNEALEKLESVRQGFIDVGIGFDAAMVSLELSLLLLERGETARVKQIAQEAFQIFSAQAVHRETFSSLKIFRDAAVAETLTAATVQKVHAHLRTVGALPVDLSSAS